jgi:hypothetical protein
MLRRLQGILVPLAVLSTLALLTAVFTVRLDAQGGGQDRLEAGQLIQALSTFWSAGEYEQARVLIDAKLLEKPGWLPAVILKSAYYRYIDGNSGSALTILESAGGTVGSLDPDVYANFIAAYTIYKHALEAEGSFTQEQKDARRELARQIFVYFPGAEIVAIYFTTETQ